MTKCRLALALVLACGFATTATAKQHRVSAQQVKRQQVKAKRVKPQKYKARKIKRNGA
jgi:hypothetical protein